MDILIKLAGSHPLIRKMGMVFNDELTTIRVERESVGDIGSVEITADGSIRTGEYTVKISRLLSHEHDAWHFDVGEGIAFNIHKTPRGHMSIEYMSGEAKWTHSFPRPDAIPPMHPADQ